MHPKMFAGDCCQQLTLFLLLILTSSLTAHSAEIDSFRYINRYHVFNAIHSSMRRWESALNHNGMSFFLATAPQGTQFYHGNQLPDRLNDTEWVEFGVEEAMMSADSRRIPSRSGSDRGKRPIDHHRKDRSGSLADQQQYLGQSPEDQDVEKPGWLHTYVTTRELRLLYLDGMSAGKSKIGTLDSQDYLLLKGTVHGGVRQEYTRAEALCKLSQDRWGGSIDGFIRLAGGFEIIICSFRDTLWPASINRFKPEDDCTRRGYTGPAARDCLKAITPRHSESGFDKIKVYYDQFVSAYDYLPRLHVRRKDLPGPLPRLTHFNHTELEPIRSAIDSLALNHAGDHSTINWQEVTDMIVDRYGPILSLLVSEGVSSQKVLTNHIENIMSQFIDFDTRDSELELERCWQQFIPTSADQQSLPYETVRAVSYHICSALQMSSKAIDLAQGKALLRSLIRHLKWTTWKKCVACSEDEFCQVPIWPHGTIADFKHPHCQKYEKAYEGPDDYWGSVWW